MVLHIGKKEFNISKFNIFILFFIIVKIVLMGLFSSDYQDKLFYPFVMDFLNHGGNTYQSYFDNGVTNAFPYPIVMLIIETIGALLIKIFHVNNIFMINLLFKLPSFIMDLIGCLFLVKLCPEKRRYIAVLYYASPIVLYSVFMHGQLDIIPTVWLIIALYCLVSKKSNLYIYGLGIFFTILALLCKLHILAIIPIVLLYIYKRDGLKKSLLYFVLVVIGVLIGFAPVWSDGFKIGVLFNTEQSVLTKVVLNFSTVELYIPIAAVLLVYLLAFKTNYMNKELFLNLCGIVFAVFLTFCPPMPGWYVWIVPFAALYFVNSNAEKYKNIAIYVSLNMWYLIYFICYQGRDGMVDLYYLEKACTFLKVNSSMGANVLFTLMAGTLLFLVFSMYENGIASNALYKRKNIPFTIGIAGDSGAGKSTMLAVIEKCLGKNNLLYIEGDGDHRWERGDKEWDEYTALNPKANYLYRQAEDLKELRKGSSIRRVDYDHDTGKFTVPKKMRSKRYVLLCGLHSLYLPQTRKNLDLKIYLDSDEQMRRYWKIQRDTKYRGHSKEEVLKSIEERMPDAEKYIYPQKEFADMIVHYYDKNLTDCMVENYDVRMSVKLTLSAAINIEQLVYELSNYDIHIEYDYSDDLKKQIIDIDAADLEHMKIPVEQIAETVIPQLDELTRENINDVGNGKDAVVMLFLLLIISSKMQENI